MEENKFERRVREKIDELTIQPSASVWENVEKRIQNKDPRKRFVWLFAALFIGLTVGGFYLFVPNDHIANPNRYAKNNIGGNGVSSADKKNDSNVELGKVDVKSALDLTENNGNITKDGQGKLQGSSKNNSTRELILMSKNQQSKKLIETKSSLVRTITDDGETLKLADEKTENSTAVLENSLPDKELNADQTAKNVEDSSLNILTEKKTKSETISDNSVKQISKNLNQKWLIGFNISAGKTMLGNRFLGIGGEKNLADMSFNSPNSGGPIPNPQVFIDPKPWNDLAIIIGVSAQKKISKKTSFLLGVNYKYFSTLNEVGGWVSSGNYYSNLSIASFQTLKTHRNNFHFLEIPVSFQIESRQNKKLPINWQVGAGFSRLIASNSLQYQQGMFFNDNSFFNKTQVTLEGGVSALLFSKKSYPVSVGPYVSYGLNNLSGKGLYSDKHLGFIGIRTEVLLKNKK